MQFCIIVLISKWILTYRVVCPSFRLHRWQASPISRYTHNFFSTLTGYRTAVTLQTFLPCFANNRFFFSETNNVVRNVKSVTVSMPGDPFSTVHRDLVQHVWQRWWDPLASDPGSRTAGSHIHHVLIKAVRRVHGRFGKCLYQPWLTTETHT